MVVFLLGELNVKKETCVCIRWINRTIGILRSTIGVKTANDSGSIGNDGYLLVLQVEFEGKVGNQVTQWHPKRHHDILVGGR